METNKNLYSDFSYNINIFIDKYYKNLLIRGIILFFVLVSSLFIVVTSVEYVAWFNHSGRLFLFLITLISSLFIFYYFIITPLFRFLGIFNRISDKKTAEIISNNIPELKDYIFNVFELKHLSNNNDNVVLLNASIEQKIQLISKFDFLKIVSFRSSFPLLKYLITILIIFLLMLSFKPSIIIDGSKRILHFNTIYINNQGYQFIVDTSNLTLEKGNDLYINVQLKGQNFPSSLSIFIGNSEFIMERKSLDSYTLLMSSVNNSFTFTVGNDSYKSGIYSVKILHPPFLNKFSIHAIYPSYTSKISETFTRISNLKVPIGTALTFEFECNYVDSLYLVDDSIYYKFKNSNDTFEHELIILSSLNYSVNAHNKNINRNLISNSLIQSISDLYPQISIIQKENPLNRKQVYFKGNLLDDYGFTNLFFVFNGQKVNVPINLNINIQDFTFFYEFDINVSEKFSYYFEVFDNDDINGFKSTKSKIFEFNFPSYLESLEDKNRQNGDIIDKIDKSLLLALEFKKDIQEIKKKILSENLTAYEKKQFINELQSKQNTLEQILNEFAQQNKDKNSTFNSFNEQSDELLKKQNEIQKLLDVVMDDELKKLLDELQKLNEENKKNLNQQLDKLEMNYDNLSEQLDRNLELLKKFEIERDLENLSTQLDNISKDQNILSLDSTNINLTDSVLNKNINDNSELSEQYKNIQKNNSTLNNPLDLQNLDNDFNDLQKSLEDSKNSNSSESDKSKFSENSKKAKQLSEQIKTMLNNNSSDENGENAQTLRQILENLFYFSFKQEDIYEAFKYSNRNSPNFNQNINSQNNLTSNFSIIKDSLFQLSLRTPYLGNHINMKVSSIVNSLYDIDFYIKENKLSKLYIEQRKSIQFSNDLILLLSESLKNMENSSSGSGSSKSKSKKKKPQKGEPSLSEMRKSQESMKSQLEGMIKQMKEGKGKNGEFTSQQLGKMLSQQEIFQNSMNQLKNSQGVGSEVTKQLNEINKLIEQNKRDIINNNVNNQSVIRQQQIVTRLLQAENAQMERELDNKRKSIESLNYTISNPNDYIFNDTNTVIFDDILNNNNVKLNYFYRNKFQEYIKNLN